MSVIAASAERLHAGALVALHREGLRRQPVLWGVAVLMIALMAPTAGAYLLDARLLNGISVWIKPLKFEFSVVLYFGTLAWFWGYIREPAAAGRFLKWFATAAAIAVVAEIAIIIIQASRAELSHFNVATPLDAMLFRLMGILVLVFMSLSLVAAIAIARFPSPRLSPAFRLSLVLGLVLTFVLGMTTGFITVANGGHWVGGVPDDAGGLPIFGWSRTGGDLRVAHFFGLHAMQFVPIAGAMIAAVRPTATGAVWAVAAAVTAITVYTLAEALAGEPFLAFLG